MLLFLFCSPVETVSGRVYLLLVSTFDNFCCKQHVLDVCKELYMNIRAIYSHVIVYLPVCL